MAVVALAMGRGWERPQAFSVHAPRKLSEKKEELKGGRNGSLAGVSDEAPPKVPTGRGPARRLARPLRL